MAAVFNRLGYTASRSGTCRPARRKCIIPISAHRQFQVSSRRRADDDDEGDSTSRPTRLPFKFSLADLDPEERRAYKSLSAEEQKEWEEDSRKMYEHMTSPEVEQQLASDIALAAHEVAEETPHAEISIPRIKPGLMSMGELEEQDSGEDEEFEGDDITSLGHGELEQHRELREYARIAAWEMPLLSSMTSPPPNVSNAYGPVPADTYGQTELAKPFQPPALDQPLRFRYTTYMGETHPAEKKVVLEFCTRDLPSLTEAQRIKLIKLVGPRYNPEKDLVKMSSEMFETQAQNKRYLGDLVDSLMAEAKDKSDMFEDVPLDFRHHRFKSRPEFPEGWKLDAKRREHLERDRKQRAIADGAREQEGRMIVGASIIEEAMKALPVRDASRVLVEAQQGKRGKQARGKTRALR